MSAAQFIIPLESSNAADSILVGPKASRLALLARAGLPTPGGFCLTADAYRHQMAHVGIEPLARTFTEAAPPQQRRLAVEIRLKLYQQPIAPEILRELLSAWREN